MEWIDRETAETYRDFLQTEYGADMVWYHLMNKKMPDNLLMIRSELRLLDTMLYGYPQRDIA